MRFQLYQSHTMIAIGLESGKNPINWVSVGILDTLNVTLKLKLQTSNFFFFFFIIPT